MSAAANNFGSFMNALAFVCVAIKIGRKIMPKTQLEILGQTLKETRAGIKEASVLGINVGGFEDALRRYVLHFFHASHSFDLCLRSLSVMIPVLTFLSCPSHNPIAVSKKNINHSIFKPTLSLGCL